MKAYAFNDGYIPVVAPFDWYTWSRMTGKEQNEKMKKKAHKQLLSLVLALVMTVSVLPAAAFATEEDPGATDDYGISPYFADPGDPSESFEPWVHGYRYVDLLAFDPSTDPYAEEMRATIPLQGRNSTFSATQANPGLTDESQLYVLSASNYRNTGADAYNGNASYDDFTYAPFMYWQYTDITGTGGRPTPGMYRGIDTGKAPDGRDLGIEFCPVAIPMAAATNVAHRNGVMSLGEFFIDATWRGGQFVEEFIYQDEDGNYPYAQKMIEIMEYYGFDGYFINIEASFDAGYVDTLRDILRWMREQGAYIQWYDAINDSGTVSYVNQFNEQNSNWVTNGVSDSIFLNYWSYDDMLANSKAYAESLGLDPYDTVFMGVEGNGWRFNFDFDTGTADEGNSIAGSPVGIDANGQPLSSFGVWSSDFYQNEYHDRFDPGYQWEAEERARMYYTSRTENAGDYTEADRPDVGVSNPMFKGFSKYVVEKSVINGTVFATDFSNGHGMQYWREGVVSRDMEWTNYGLQDILPTWQWWVESDDELTDAAIMAMEEEYLKDEDPDEGESTDVNNEPPADVENDVNNEPPADLENDVNNEPPADLENDVNNEPPADLESDVNNEPPADLESDVNNEPPADVEGDVNNEPPADVENDVNNEPPADLENDVNNEPPADLENDVNNEPSADPEDDVNNDPPAAPEDDVNNEPPADVENDVNNEPPADEDPIEDDFAPYVLPRAAELLELDWDYGPDFYRLDSNRNDFPFPYKQIGAYNGGSSLAVYGSLTGSQIVNLYKTDLRITSSSSISLTYNKPSATDSSQMYIVLALQNGNTVEKVYLPIENSNLRTRGWETATLDLSDLAGETIAAIGVGFTASEVIDDYQVNLGRLEITDGGNYRPSQPTGLHLVHRFDHTDEIQIAWNQRDFGDVQNYYVFAEYANGSERFVGGGYAANYFIKNLENADNVTALKLYAVGRDSSLSAPATLELATGDRLANIRTTTANNKLTVTWQDGSPVYSNDTVEVSLSWWGTDKTPVAPVTVPAGTEMAVFDIPLEDGSSYILTLTPTSNGIEQEPVNYFGMITDTYSAPYDGEVRKMPTAENDGKYLLTTPTASDWRAMLVETSSGSERYARFSEIHNEWGAFQGIRAKDILINTTGSDFMTVRVEDIYNNVSEPVTFLFKDGKPVTGSSDFGEELFPDPVLRAAVQAQVGTSYDKLSSFTGTLDLSGTAVSDLTGINSLGKMSELKLDNCTSLNTVDMTQLPGIKVSVTGCSNLVTLYMPGTKQTSLDITGVNKLRYFDISNSQIDTLTADEADTYTNVFTWNWQGAKMDLSDNTPEGQLKNDIAGYFSNGSQPELGEVGIKFYNEEAWNVYPPSDYVMELGQDILLKTVGYKNTFHNTDWGDSYDLVAGTVYVSMDGNNYTEVTSFNISPAYDVVIQIPDNTIARYVWVRCTEVVSAEFFCTEQWTVTGQSLIYAGFNYSNQQPSITIDDVPALTVQNDGKTYQLLNLLTDSYNKAVTNRGNTPASLLGADWVDQNYLAPYATQPEAVRVVITKPDGSTYIYPSAPSLGDIDMTPLAVQNVIAKAQVNEGEAGEFAFDGKSDTKWCDNSDGGQSSWLGFELTQPEVIGQWYTLHAGHTNDGPGAITRDFRLQMLDPEKVSEADYLAQGTDNKRSILEIDDNWTDVDVVTGNTQNDVSRLLAQNSLTSAQVYRLKIDQSIQPDANGVGAAIRLHKLELYAYSGELGSESTNGLFKADDAGTYYVKYLRPGDVTGNVIANTTVTVQGTPPVDPPVVPPVDPPVDPPVNPPVDPPVTPGGSTGGSSGGSTEKPSEPSRPSGDTFATVEVETEGNTSSVTLDGSIADAIIAEAVNKDSENIILTVDAPDHANEVVITIPASTMADLTDKTDANLTVSSPIADVTITNDGLASLGSGAASVEIAAKADGDTVQITVSKDGQPVSNIPGGLQASIPVADAAPGTVAILVDENGNETILKKAVAMDGTMDLALAGSATIKIVDNSKDFTDTQTHWASDSIDFVTSRELFQGTGPDTFSADAPMSRAMLVTVLHRLEDTPAASGGSGFADVDANAYYADAVAWASGLSIVTGNGTGFNPDGQVTREELATFLYRYAKATGAGAGTSGSLSGFSDGGAVSGWASEAMQWAVGAGIIGGSNGKLNPSSPATRAEVATILMRFCQNLAK